VTVASDSAVPDAKARMINLQERQVATGINVKGQAPFVVVLFTAVVIETGEVIILAQDQEFVTQMKSQSSIAELLKQNEHFELSGFQVIVRTASSYIGNRTAYECLAIRAHDGSVSNSFFITPA
jgi:hypothetical protein